MSDDTIVAYTIGPNNEYIDCSNCGHRSYNPNDVQQKYCGYCHRFLDNPPTKKGEKWKTK